MNFYSCKKKIKLCCIDESAMVSSVYGAQDVVQHNFYYFNSFNTSNIGLNVS